MDSNNYNFKKVEKNILENINFQKLYKSKPKSKNPPFVTVMPPPNITGNLHIGHALVLTLQDILTRYNRMRGLDTLWQAGVDHAGIATQLVVEKRLKEHGISKESLGKDGFVSEVLKWKEEAQDKILEQVQKMGSSCDFSNIAFTFSKEFNNAVNKVFISLFKEGLIYQDYKLVNWDTKFETAISDLEVINKEEKGNLYYIKYSINNNNNIIIATTRPETMFGDTAIAVNPEDRRYTHLIGKKAKIPIINKEITIIADSYSDPEKGTGAVKITPAHDFNDFEVGQRHKLPLVIVINSKGKLNENVPQEFIGLSIQEARKKVVNTLEEIGSLEKIEKHIMQVPYGDRSNTVIEPLPSKQWFLNVSTMAKEAIKAVKNKEVVLIPSSWENLYFEWMNNIKPWCISRQLWWGHRIPVWHSLEEDKKIFVTNNKEEALQEAEKYYGKKVNIEQDNSVLDTWFSSALWPFVTMGWPDLNSERLKKYYPTSTLVTGFDILFFWVARMIMMGKHFLKQVPFKEVYLHSLILDEKGQKMSKTKGNVINPLDLIDKYGTDAFRFTLTSYASNTQNIKFSEKILEGSRNFVTKIWNVYRFLKHYECSIDNNFNPETVSEDINMWILSELQKLTEEMQVIIKNYQFNELTNKIYHFTWSTFCDWYIEIIKLVFTNKELDYIKDETSKTAMFVFNTLICLMHPVMPFITQHLYNLLNDNKDVFLTNVSYPTNIINHNAISRFNSANKNISYVLSFITKIRSIRSSVKVPAAAFIDIYLLDKGNISLLQSNSLVIKKLARLKDMLFVSEIDNKKLFTDVIDHNLIVGLDIKNIIDINKEKLRLNKEKEIIIKEISIIDTKLCNTNFINRAPKDILDNILSQKIMFEDKLKAINSVIDKLDT